MATGRTSDPDNESIPAWNHNGWYLQQSEVYHPQEAHDPLFQRTLESCVASIDVHLVNGGLHGSDAPGSGAELAETVRHQDDPFLCALRTQGVQGMKRLFHGMLTQDGSMRQSAMERPPAEER